jgi:hypothetical protein
MAALCAAAAAAAAGSTAAAAAVVVVVAVAAAPRPVPISKSIGDGDANTVNGTSAVLELSKDPCDFCSDDCQTQACQGNSGYALAYCYMIKQAVVYADTPVGNTSILHAYQKLYY